MDSSPKCSVVYVGLDEEKRNRNWSSVSEQKSPNEGYRLTIELKDIINQFMAQVIQTLILMQDITIYSAIMETLWKYYILLSLSSYYGHCLTMDA